MSFKTSLKTYLLKNVVRDLTPGMENSLFFFIARTEDWPGSVPTYADTARSQHDVSRRMITAKKISSTEACLVAPRNTWVYDTAYSMYAGDVDVASDIKHYVTNGQNQVYKCLKNGTYGGDKKSTVEPTGNGVGVIKTHDGYEWKFMFSVPESLDRFATDSLIPIRTLEVDVEDPLKYKDDRFPQYTVQYSAVKGSISTVEVLSAGGSYSGHVRYRQDGINATSFSLVSNNTGGSAEVNFNNSNASSVNDFYNGYQIHIVSGDGVGQRLLINDYDGANRKAILNKSFRYAPNANGNSRYEIVPELIISGDGTGAYAVPIMNDGALGYGFISGINLLDIGREYTHASAEVSTANAGDGTTLDVHISPDYGHGDDPERELIATKLMILTTIEKSSSGITGNNRDGDLPLRNDYHQFGIIRNPIYATGDRAGEVAGIDSGSFTNIIIDAPDGEIFGSSDLLPGDFVVGYTSKCAGEVHKFNRSSDTKRSTITVRDISSSFSPGELVVGISPSGVAGGLWTSSGKGSGYYKYSEDTIPVLSNDTYRLSTRLVVGTTGADNGDVWEPNAITLDHYLVGASGSSAAVVEFVPHPSAITADIYVTNLTRPTYDAPYNGFAIGENIINLSKVAEILEIHIPEFVHNSGDILYIKNAESIERNYEQEEVFKITLDI